MHNSFDPQNNFSYLCYLILLIKEVENRKDEYLVKVSLAVSGRARI